MWTSYSRAIAVAYLPYGKSKTRERTKQKVDAPSDIGLQLARSKEYTCASNERLNISADWESAPYLNFLRDAPTQIRWQCGATLNLFNHGAPVEHLKNHGFWNKRQISLIEYDTNTKVPSAESLKLARMWADFYQPYRHEERRGIDTGGTPKKIVKSWIKHGYATVHSFSGHQDRRPLLAYNGRRIKHETSGGLASVKELEGSTVKDPKYKHFMTSPTQPGNSKISLNEMCVVDRKTHEKIGGVYIHSAATVYQDIHLPSLIEIKRLEDDRMDIAWIQIDMRGVEPNEETLRAWKRGAPITDLQTTLVQTFWDLMKHYASLDKLRDGPAYILSSAKNGDRMVQLLTHVNRQMQGVNPYNKDGSLHDEVVVPKAIHTVYFFGDLHGSVDSVSKILLWLRENRVVDDDGVVRPGYGVISGGDLMDRGEYGESCVLAFYFIFLQTRDAKGKKGFCGIARGNHEDCELGSAFGHKDEHNARRFNAESE